MSREFLGAEEYNLDSPQNGPDDVDLGTFEADAPFRRTPPRPSARNLQEITDWAVRDLTGEGREPEPIEQPLPPLSFGRPSSADVVGADEDEPEPIFLRYEHEEDFTEDLADDAEAPHAPDAPVAPAGPPRAGTRRGRPPYVAIVVGALFIALLGAAFAFEQTTRFIEGRAVDDAQVVGYLSNQNFDIDSNQSGGVLLNGDFFLTTSASMPLTLQRIDLGYGPVDVPADVVLRGNRLTKVHLTVQTDCGSPTSAPAADVLSPDGRHYRLPVSGPPEEVADVGTKFWCDGGNATDGTGSGGSTSSYVNPGSATAFGVRVVEMSVHGRAFRVTFAAGPQAPETNISILPTNSPRDPRARTSWKITLDPPGLVDLRPGSQATVVVGLEYPKCATAQQQPTLAPIRVLAVPVDAPDSPRDSIEGWQEDVVTQTARNALGADCGS